MIIQFRMRGIILMLLTVVFYSCNTDKNNNLSTIDTETLFTLLDAKETGIDFLNKVKN